MSEPFLRVVRGEPTEAELAALVAVLSRRGGAAAPEPLDEAPGWGRPPSLHPGPRAWRASARIPGVRTRAGW